VSAADSVAGEPRGAASGGLRVACAGTPEFAAQALRALLRAGYEVPLVLTQPDRPAGRGMRPQPSAVKRVALEHALPLEQPRGLRLDGRYPEDAKQARETLRRAAPDVLVVVAYGLLLPQWVLDLPSLGCLNIHASLLPRWRGAAPIQRAIEAGDALSGVSIMHMDAGLDTGPVYRMEETPILAADTAATLHDRLAGLGSGLLLQVLSDLRQGVAEPTAQPNDGVSYAAKIDKAEAWLDYRRPAAELERRIRAFEPHPGTRTCVGDTQLKVHGARLGTGATAADAAPGQVLRADAAGIEIACGEGTLVLTRLQRAGGNAVDAAALLRGLPIRAGERFACEFPGAAT
jgi:methionyl-tRNA formyltransferase